MPIDIIQVKQKHTKTLGGWWAYDVRTNEDIEKGFQAYEAYKQTRSPQSAGAAEATAPPLGSIIKPRECNLHVESCWNDEDDDDDAFFDSDFDGFDNDEIPEDWSSDSSSDFEMQYGAEFDASDPSKLQQLICGQIYIIDLVQMTQTLRSQSARLRKIMRCKGSEATPNAFKGVAGIKRN